MTIQNVGGEMVFNYRKYIVGGLLGTNYTATIALVILTAQVTSKTSFALWV